MEYHVEGLLRGNRFKDLWDIQSADARKKYNLKKMDLEVLLYLNSNPEKNTAGDIQRFFNINKGYISQVVDHLCKMQYVTAVPDTEDRRYIHYVVCQKTEWVAKDLQEARDRLVEQMFQGISEEERLIFRRVAKRLNQNMMEMLTQK